MKETLTVPVNSVYVFMNTQIIEDVWQGESDPVPWQASKKVYTTRSGIMVVTEDFTPSTAFVLPYNIRPVACLELVYVIASGARITVDTVNAPPRIIAVSSGYRAISWLGSGNGMVKLPGLKPFKVMHLYIPWRKFDAIFTGHARMVNRFIRNVIPQRVICGLVEKMPVTVESIVHQIFHCCLAPPASTLYIEAKVMELLAWELEQWCGGQRSAVGLPPADIRRLQQARRIILDRYQDPPGLVSLARSVGLNVNKLKTGFRKMYNDTVYGVLKSYRMETARMLLQKGEANVSEAAFAVGYSNISHFSTAFRKTYGVLPGQYLKEVGRTFFSTTA